MKLNPIALIIGALVLIGVGVGGGFFLSNALFAGSGESDETVTAPTLDPNAIPTLSYSQLQAENERLTGQVAALSTQVATVSSQAQTRNLPEVEATDIPKPEEPVTAEPVPTEVASVPSERLLFRILQEESEVRFNIYEELNGAPFTVVGTTNQVAGDIVVDFANPNTSQVGEIVIDLRTLRTDNGNRDNAIRGRILQSSTDAYQFARFVPTDVSGLPTTPVAVGDTITFTVTGDLTLVETTNPVTFQMTLTVESDSRLVGSGVAQILYPDYNLRIPSVPFVANVANEVDLFIDFVATKVDA
ncbi:MAG: YceI family protein [Anaerolineae bacterium]|jgi:polyisoprenoid-binding protein YceI|nr:YceI family protein [Anaerolineae bacterium]